MSSGAPSSASWIAAAGIVLGSFASDAAAREHSVHFELEPQPLSQALIAFAVQANVSIATPPDGLGAASGAAVSGAYEPAAALRRLLAGSGYGFVKVDSATFRIVPAGRQTAAAEPKPAPDAVSAIIVTARRRPETLDRLPAAATVVGEESLGDLGARSLQDIAPVTAGLSSTNLGSGRDKTFIRGLSDGAFSGRTASTVGIYLDDSRVTYGAPNPDLLLIDVDRVEVLRGPQGALYGSGSIGGIVHVVSQQPDLYVRSGVVSGEFAGARGAAPNDAVSIVVNQPLVEGRLGLRASAYGRTDGGWLDNPALRARDTNATKTSGERLTAMARLDDGWQVTAKALHQDIRAQDAQYVDGSAGQRVRLPKVKEPYSVGFTLGGVSLSGPTALGRLTSTTTLVRHSFSNRFDASGAFTDLGLARKDVAAFDTESELNFVIEEAQIASAASPFPWTVGVFGSYGVIDTEDRLSMAHTRATPYSAGRRDKLSELAVYGDVALPLSARWTLNFGARAYRSSIEVHAAARSVNGALNDDFAGDRTTLGVSPELQLSYEPDGRAFYYFRFSEGNRAGGFNAGAAALLTADAQRGMQPARRFGPDRLLSGELGAKWTLRDGAMRIRAAAYWQGWENIQTDQLLASGLPFTGNVGNGLNRGIEVETSLDLGRGLTAIGHVSVSQHDIIGADPSFPESADAGLPGSPHVTAGAAFVATRDLGGWGVGKIVLDGLYIGTSDVSFTESTSRETGGYVDASVRVVLERRQWRLSAYIKNLADRESGTFSYGNPFRFGDPTLVTPLRPRDFGIELARRF